MAKQVQVAVIGGGNMAEALIKGVLAKTIFSAAEIIVAEPREERRQYLSQTYKVIVTPSNSEAAREGQILLLCTKPQIIDGIMDEISSYCRPGALILSILAGVTLKRLSDGLKQDHLVRVMPNTPAQFAKGMSVWTATGQLSLEQKALSKKILGSLGEEIFVDSEDYLDMATALSGTGPAYVFLFVEALIDAGVHLGFSRHIAEELVLQTMEGSLVMVREMKRHPATLRNMVTSPGGTSAAALYELEKGGFRTILSKAIFAAYKRSVDLGK